MEAAGVEGRMVPVGEQEIEVPADQWACPKCDKIYNSRHAYRNHLKNKHGLGLKDIEQERMDVCVAEFPVDVQAQLRQLQQDMRRVAANVRQFSSSSSTAAPTSIGDIHGERRQRQQTDLFNRRMKKRKANVDSDELIVRSGIVAPELRTTQKSANRVKRDQAIAEEVTIAYNL